jgi:hypothetical protein
MSSGNIKKKKCFWGVKCGRCVGLTTLQPCVSRLSGQRGILSISQPCRPPRPLTGIDFTFFYFILYKLSQKIRITFASEIISILRMFICKEQIQQKVHLSAEPPVCVPSAAHPYSRILGFLDRSRYYFFQVAPRLYSRG